MNPNLHGIDNTVTTGCTPPTSCVTRLLSRTEADERAVIDNAFPFDSMFEGLGQQADQRLPDGPDTARHLVALAASMREARGTAAGDSGIPAAYTYLGQFIDHDITHTDFPGALKALQEEAFRAAKRGERVDPLAPEQIAQAVNRRVPSLNLDSVLSSAAPRDAAGALVVGAVSAVPGLNRPTLPFDESAEWAPLHDLPRLPPTSANLVLDRQALIGDPRNDENLAVAQMHVAFLRAHRRLVHELGLAPAQADLELARFFQALVLDDFLPRFCDPDIVAAVRAAPGRFYRPSRERPYMPLEFSVAAFRSGHSMIRNAYNYNSEFSGGGTKPIATLGDLFTFTAFSGTNQGVPRLPHNWIIDWTRWVDEGSGASANPARRIDTHIASSLESIPQHRNVLAADAVPELALRNLVRGYLLRLPTGQAIAARVRQAMPDLPLMSDADLMAVAQAAGEAQATALTNSGFATRTPLWYYVLAEASHVARTRQDPRDSSRAASHLGPVGSVIVAETLVQLVRLADDNVIDTGASWRPAFPTVTPGQVTLVDLFRLAKVFPDPAAARA